jgi:tetratricopeptide (TPR) repeat protein
MGNGVHFNLRRPPNERDFPELDENVAYTLGMCYERMGQRKAAVDTYTEALSRHPHNGELLVSRGLAVYESDQGAGLLDFAAAAAHYGVASIWPYLVLARHFLQTGVPGEALKMALSASRQPGPTHARADVYEAIGIALALLGQPQARVLETFDQALALDPTNDRIRRNRQIATLRPQSRQGGKRRFDPSSIQPERLRRERGHELVTRMEVINEEFGKRAEGAFAGVQ